MAASEAAAKTAAEAANQALGRKQEKQNELTPPLVKRSNSQPPHHEGGPS
ncbi:MAG TPA: hypothetical protein VGR55_02425 [Candidatus Acidoferrum sp.]|nr:hypothetical protein [Candidatus Acidoferrum sp.]